MKTRAVSVPLALLALALPSVADTFVLKDGSTLEGKVLRQDPENYVVEVQVTKSIKDERVIPKADVASIKQEKLDLTAFDEKIAKLVPTPDALTAEEYSARIAAVEKFLVEHRGSDKSREAKAILATLKGEANEVLAGGVKTGGKIISPSDYRANAYDIDARIEAAKIKRLIDESRQLEALRAFSAFDADFRNTQSRGELLPLIKRVIGSYLAGISQSLTTFDARAKERQVGLSRMSSADRRNTEAALAEETASFEKRLKAEKDAKIGWVSTDPSFKPSLEETMNFGKQELSRLSSSENSAALDAGKAYREALSKLQSGTDKTSATTIIGAARTAGVPQRYIDHLEAAAKAAGFKP
jgi:hypothetical protein